MVYFCISPLMRLLTTEKAFWNKADCPIVPVISWNLHMGTVNANSSFGMSGRADGSSMPMKQRRPPLAFSFTAKDTMLQQPEAKRAHTASSSLLS